MLRVCSCLVLLATAARAQTPRDTFRLDSIVVTATRLPTSRASVASAVTVLSGEALRAQGIRYVADALRLVPGAAVAQNGSFGATSSLFLRGGESDYVQVLVDGVPVNGPGGAFDWGGFSTDNVERIEIVGGPVSVLYGSDAVAGVVQVFTRRGTGPATIEAGVRGGTFGSFIWEAGLRGAAPALNYALAVSRLRTDGSYAYNNAHRNAVASGRFHVAPDSRTDATLTVRHTDHEYHFPTDGAGRLVDRNQFTFQDGTALGLDLGRQLSGRVQARLLLSSHETDGGFDDRVDTAADTLGFYGSQSLSHGRRRSADLQVTAVAGASATLTAGIKRESQAEREVSESQSQFGSSSSSSDFDRSNRGYYGQALLEPARAVSLTVGGRVDDNETFGSFATYRVGAAVRLAPGTRIRGSLGTGFKEPTFFENFATGFVIGNPALEPERSRSWELGAERQVLGGRVWVSATYFSQAFRDLIQYTPAPPTPADPNYFNVAAANASGIEVTLRLRLPGVAVEGNYTWLRTEVTDAGFDVGPDATFVNGEPLLRRPAHSAALSANGVVAGRATVGAALRYVGPRTDRDFARFPAPRLTLPAYTVVDVSGALELLGGAGHRLTATLRVENLLDREYSEIANFPARGRTVFVGGRFAM